MKLKLKKLDGLVFEEASHTYMLNGKLLPGVTTILDGKAKDFLKWWTVKLMYETLLPKLQEVQGITEETWQTILEDAKKAHTKKSKEALVSGKIAHEFIERIIKYLIRTPLNQDKYLALMEILKKEMPTDEKAVNSINNFLDWMRQHKVEWLASELKLASPTYEFAGTIDAVAMVDGRLTIVDFKTSNQISDEYWLQTGAYHLLLDDNLEDKEERPVDRLILRIPKTGDGFEAKVAPIPLDLCIKTFLALREVRKFDSWIENNK